MLSGDATTIQPWPFEQTLTALQRFSQRLESYEIPDKGRVAEYRRHIERMIDPHSESDNLVLFGRMPESRRQAMAFGIIEAQEFAEFGEAFDDWSCPHLQERLRTAIRGPAHPLDESGANQGARSAAFELMLATHLKKAGFQPKFGTNPDLRAEIEGCEILIECKRPLADRAVGTNLDRARRQLRRCFDESATNDKVGLIALSLSRVMLRHRPLDDGPFYFARSIGDADDLLGAILKANADTYVPNQLQEPCCSGMLLHITAPFKIHGKFTVRTRITINGHPGPLERLSARITT